MLRTSLKAALVASGMTLAFASTASAAETVKLDLRNPNNVHPSPGGTSSDKAPAKSSVLAQGTNYIFEVTGTGSVWTRETYGSLGSCGVAEERPIELSAGFKTAPAAWDAATVFAAPRGVKIGPLGTACAGVRLPMTVAPQLYGGFQITTGGIYDRPVPIGGVRNVPRSDHTYFWRLAGQNRPASFRFSDNKVADNTGVFTITIRSEAECAAIDCLKYAMPEFDQAFAPKIPAAGFSVPVEGTRQCTGSKVLSVRLVQPKGVKFRKASYYINGKKKRMVGRKTMFIKKGKKAIRAQKFRNLPNGTLKLRIEITTEVGQRLTVKRTVPRCNPRKKARSIKLT